MFLILFFVNKIKENIILKEFYERFNKRMVKEISNT